MAAKHVRKFFGHVVKGLEKKDKFFKTVFKEDKQQSLTKPSDWNLVKKELKDIYDGVQTNKFNLEILQESNNNIESEIEKINQFEQNLAQVLGKIEIKDIEHNEKYKTDIIRKLNSNILNVDNHVNNIKKIREHKASGLQNRLDKLENLMLQIIDNHNKVITETKERKHRINHIEKKMSKHLGNEDFKIIELKDKIENLEQLYKNAVKGYADPNILTKIRAKINLFKKTIEDY
ncbi:hypothetical protein HN555_01805 [Candidatus Woesearchaeota archaeon]|nr:hypothetical protein [Candidatus Woesearchaeota archaeon]